MSKKAIKFLPILYFLILSLIILGPMLGKGYIFLLDFSLPSEIKFDPASYFGGREITASGLPLDFLIFIFSKIVSTDILQKALFILILTLIGSIAFYVLPKKLEIAPRIIAATFYLINPFVYERFMAGHIAVLLGYALLPLCFYYLSQSFEGGKNKDIFLFCFFWTLQIFFAIHYLTITGILLMVFLFVNLFFQKPRRKMMVFLKIIGFFLVLNSFWIIPIFFRGFTKLGEFNLSHFEVFRSSADEKYGLFLNLLALYGFWRERTAPDEVVLTKNFLPFWPIFYGLFLIPMFFGIKQLLKEKQKKILAIAALMIFAAVFLSMGPAENTIGSINKWIFLYIPGFKGLREPQKLISLLILSYIFLVAYGLYYLKNIKIKWRHTVISLVIFANIFIYNYKMFWGFSGQIKPVPYPASYKKGKKILDQDKSNFEILSLPWQMYMKYSIADGRTIIDPARYYFNHPTVSTKFINLKIDNFKETWEEKKILKLLRSTNANLWHEILKDMNVKYIFINKVPLEPAEEFNDWFLEQSDNFEILAEDEYGKLYKLVP